MGFESFPTIEPEIESKNDINFLDRGLSSEKLEEKGKESDFESRSVENEENHPSLDDLIQAAEKRKEEHFGISSDEVEEKAPDAKNVLYDKRKVRDISLKYGSVLREEGIEKEKTRPNDGSEIGETLNGDDSYYGIPGQAS